MVMRTLGIQEIPTDASADPGNEVFPLKLQSRILREQPLRTDQDEQDSPYWDLDRTSGREKRDRPVKRLSSGSIAAPRMTLLHVDEGAEPSRVPAPRRTLPGEEQAHRILRNHFARAALAEIDLLTAAAKTPHAAVFAEGFLRTVRRMRDTYSRDPLFLVLDALHDALAHNNRWISYTADQLKEARRIVDEFVKRKVDVPSAEKAVAALEAAGFDTLPFAVEFDLFDAADGEDD